MPYSKTGLSEWAVHVTIDGDEHVLLVMAEDEEDVRTILAGHHQRGARIHHGVAYCHEADSMIVEWGSVKTFDVGAIEWVRTWGPDGEIRVRPET